MWQWNAKNLIDCVNIWERSKAAKLIFQYILVLNWVKRCLNLKIFKLPGISESDTINFFHVLSRNELPKSVCSQFSLVHEVYTCDTRYNLLIYIPRMSASQYGKHYLRSNGSSLWNKLFKDFFQKYHLTSFLKLNSFLMKWFLQSCKNDL